MKQPHIFDVLVVYTNSVAVSAADPSNLSTTPFISRSSRSDYNLSYAYFLDTCRKFHIKAAFSTSADIIGDGTCSSYWLHKRNRWERISHPCSAPQIFDKFSPVNVAKKIERDLLFSGTDTIPFNHAELAALFFDKFTIYNTYPQHTIPKVNVTVAKNGVQKAMARLRHVIALHPKKEDFNSAVIVKDRFGAGGECIYKVDANFEKQITLIVSDNGDKSFVLQPFINFDSGFKYKKSQTATDIRCIFHRGNLLQTYIRQAKANNFLCNEHQGGKLTYVSPKEIPAKIKRLATAIANTLNVYQGLFALDFIMSNTGNVYFLEGNIGPGIDWNLKQKKNERMSKKLIRQIISEIAFRKKEKSHQFLFESGWGHHYAPKIAI